MRRSLILLSAFVAALVAAPQAQPPAAGPASVDPALLAELTWRNIGPHRASRTRAMTGVVQEPHTFYIGVSNGGVWKTTDAGRTWLPIFDRESTGSTGAIAVAPSDPRVRMRTVPEETAAAARFSGRWSASAYRTQVEKLLAGVSAAGYEVVGAPRYARFDPPWKPWFARHNEVVVPVRRA